MGPIQSFIDSAGEVIDLLRVHRSALDLAAQMPEVAVAVFQDSAKDDPEFVQSMETITHLAESAQRLGGSRRYLLNSHLLMGTWAAFEVMSHDLAVEWLISHPDCLRNSEQKVRIQLGQFVSLDQRGQAELLVDQIERAFGDTHTPGASLSEKVLATLGLSGPLEATTSRTLIEAHQVRNVLAHKGGRADGRFVDICEWLDVTSGDHIYVSDDQLELYTLFLYKYAWTLRDRCSVADGGVERGTADIDDLIRTQCAHLQTADLGWWTAPAFPGRSTRA